MKYNFKEILNAEIYNSTKVMFILGKYTWFNNMVSDTLKYMCIDQDNTFESTISIGDEFGLSSDTNNNDISNSVDFSTFMDVIGVSSINGKWFCRTELNMLTKKQKDKLLSYIKEPSDNGILVVVSTDWKDYKDILRNRVLSFSKVSHIMQLSFPNRNVLKSIVKQSFSEKNIEIDSGALDFFLMRMSSAYDKYEEVIDSIVSMHKSELLTSKDLKVYMKGIENFIVDDYVEELTKPMVSDKTNSKKVLKMMVALEDELGAKSLLYQVLKKVDEYIDYRLLINDGYIPIGINYFFNDVINSLPNKEKYEKVNEWVFRRKAEIASRTSLRDWTYIKLILSKAIENNRLPEDIIDMKCQKALYEISTRSVLKENRLNNIIGVDNILKREMNNLNKVVYDENAIDKINHDIKMSELT